MPRCRAAAACVRRGGAAPRPPSLRLFLPPPPSISAPGALRRPSARGRRAGRAGNPPAAQPPQPGRPAAPPAPRRLPRALGPGLPAAAMGLRCEGLRRKRGPGSTERERGWEGGRADALLGCARDLSGLFQPSFGFHASMNPAALSPSPSPSPSPRAAPRRAQPCLRGSRRICRFSLLSLLNFFKYVTNNWLNERQSQ